jgi:hypothetical protein
MSADARDLVLPMQLVPALQAGDLLHFAGERQPFAIVTIDWKTGLLTLRRDWTGPSYAEWVQARAGVSRGG